MILTKVINELLIYFTELAGNKSIYIITDVMKATVTAVITNDKDSTEKIPVGSQPIAFSYSKFRLMSDGEVGEQVVNFYATFFIIIIKCFNNIFL